METLSIPSKAPLLYVVFTAEINPSTVERLTEVMIQAAKKNVAKVYLAFSTPGGEVRSGIALYNTLLGMPFDLTVHNLSSVNSVGNVVFLAGVNRYATPHSTFMFHGVGLDVNSRTRVEEQIARNWLDSILADQSRMGSIIAERSNLGSPEIAKLFSTQRTVDADWAMQNGIIQDIKDFSVPNGTPVLSLVFNRQVAQ